MHGVWQLDKFDKLCKIVCLSCVMKRDFIVLPSNYFIAQIYFKFTLLIAMTN
jgi:hypothetical protein